MSQEQRQFGKRLRQNDGNHDPGPDPPPPRAHPTIARPTPLPPQPYPQLNNLPILPEPSRCLGKAQMPMEEFQAFSNIDFEGLGLLGDPPSLSSQAPVDPLEPALSTSISANESSPSSIPLEAPKRIFTAEEFELLRQEVLELEKRVELEAKRKQELEKELLHIQALIEHLTATMPSIIAEIKRKSREKMKQFAAECNREVEEVRKENLRRRKERGIGPDEDVYEFLEKRKKELRLKQMKLIRLRKLQKEINKKRFAIKDGKVVELNPLAPDGTREGKESVSTGGVFPPPDAIGGDQTSKLDKNGSAGNFLNAP